MPGRKHLQVGTNRECTKPAQGNRDRALVSINLRPFASYLTNAIGELSPLMNDRLYQLVYITPAPRAHLYLAPSTATGNSVVYGYATMPRS
jgi:hypothetical protein